MVEELKLKKMSTIQDFYITLPSNVKSNDDTNILSQYRTKLKKRYEFPQNEDWRVGLAEILYTQTWYNVREKSKIRFLTEDGNIIEDNAFNIAYDGYREETSPNYIQPGYYRKIEDLINVINIKLKFTQISNASSNSDSPKLSFDGISNKVTIECGNYYDLGPGLSERKSYIPIFETDIEKMLGIYDEEKVKLYTDEKEKTPRLIVGESLIFEVQEGPTGLPNQIEKVDESENRQKVVGAEVSGKSGTSTTPNKEDVIVNKGSFFNSKKEKTKLSFAGKFYHTAQKPVEINAGFNSMYIYSDIVQQSSVGDAYAQLLRNIPVEGSKKWGETIHLPFPEPHLTPVQSRSFDIINIDIRDDTGRTIPFESGRVVVKLIFKKYA